MTGHYVTQLYRIGYRRESISHKRGEEIKLIIKESGEKAGHTYSGRLDDEIAQNKSVNNRV